MSSLFSDAAIRRYEPIIIANIKKFVTLLIHEKDGEYEKENDKSPRTFTKPKDMGRLIGCCNLDIFTQMFFGVNYSFMETPSIRYLCDAVNECKRRISLFVHLPILYFLKPVDRFLFPNAVQAKSHFITFIIRLMKDCANLKSKTSICTVLSEAKHEDGQELFTSKQIRSEILNLSIAGVDTTTHAIAAAFFYLSLPENAAAYERVTKEVRSAFSSIDDIRLGAELNSCTYMRGCIDEAMRLSPPGASPPFRNVLKGGATIEGNYFPEGVDIGVPTYSIHHNPEYYPDPFAFKPERWLTTETPIEAVKLAQSAHCPFYYGPRGCVGRAVGVAQLKLTLAMVLFAVDFKLDVDDKSGRFSRPNEFFAREHISALTKGPMMSFSPVEASS
jgi:cytochrome P450